MALPEYTYALLSILFWAISAPILNYGTSRIPAHSFGYSLPLYLSISGAFGCAALLPFISFSSIDNTTITYLFFAGLFTYPIATGGYYLTGYILESRMDIASLFVKLKTVFSIVIAYLILKESFSSNDLISSLLVISGILLLIISSKIKDASIYVGLAGIGTAIAWSVGELFIKFGTEQTSSIYANFIALGSGTCVSVLILIGVSIYRSDKLYINKASAASFCMHGILSFALAYACLFESIKTIGLARTVIIIAFWPFLSIVFSSILRLARNENIGISKSMLLSILLILCGSIYQVLSL